ncbi:hypothetical protein C0033_25225 [Clostridium sp. chh4-2]|uniref:hypothetical protein n=1 Tax=Clostridium sp. chh4-2 TaxID=2067550 RepID=UPI000CCE05B8|nr:hypothetical protein [Clostridium sp. chh4-2]PNV59204.1 hypothetical protein C0033_25225 [Clostridium sp. chh4-2]
MEQLEKLKKLIEQKAQYWYMVVTSFALLEILNCGILKHFIPFWAVTCVTVFLLLLMMGYVGVLYLHVRHKYREYLENNKNILLERVGLLEQNMNEMNEKNTELENRLADLIQRQNEDHTEKILNVIDNALKTELDAFNKTSNETMEKLSGFEENFDITSSRINDNLDKHGNLLLDKLIDNQKEENALFIEQSSLLTDKLESMESGFQEISDRNAYAAQEQAETLLSQCITLEKNLDGLIHEKADMLRGQTDLLNREAEILSEKLDDMQQKADQSMQECSAQMTAHTQAVLDKTEVSAKEASKAVTDYLNLVQETILNSNEKNGAEMKELAEIHMQQNAAENKQLNELIEKKSAMLTEQNTELNKEILESNERMMENAGINTEGILTHIAEAAKAGSTHLEQKTEVLTDRLDALQMKADQSMRECGERMEQHKAAVVASVEESSRTNSAEIRASIEETSGRTDGLMREMAESAAGHLTDVQKLISKLAEDEKGWIDEQSLAILGEMKEASAVENTLIREKADEALRTMELCSEKTDRLIAAQGVMIDGLIKDQGFKTGELIEERGNKTDELVNVQEIKISELVKAQGIKLSEQMETQGAKTEELIEARGNKADELMSAQGIRISELIEARGNKTDELMSNQGVKISELIEERGSKTDELMKAQKFEMNELMKTQGTKVGDLIEKQGIETNDLIKAQEIKTEDLIKAQGAMIHGLFQTQETKTEELISSQGTMTNNLIKAQGDRVDGLIKAHGELADKQLNALGNKIDIYENKTRVHSEKLAEQVVRITRELNEHQEQALHLYEKEVQAITVGLEEQVIRVQNGLEKRMDQLSVGTSMLQQSITKLLVQVLDNTDENAEKADRSYNYLFKQVNDFSKNTKSQIEQLKNELERRKQEEEQAHKTQLHAIYEDTSQVSRLNDTVTSYSKIVEVYQAGVNGKLNNLESQIASLNSLAQMLKNASEQRESVAPAGKNPNRVEEIHDQETGMTIFNHYKGNKLVLSEMKSGKKKIYEMEYDKDGRITRSRNYDNAGNVTTEMHFYTNGQVEERTERILVDGKIRIVKTKFDPNGKKIN